MNKRDASKLRGIRVLAHQNKNMRCALLRLRSGHAIALQSSHLPRTSAVALYFYMMNMTFVCFTAIGVYKEKTKGIRLIAIKDV